MFFFLQQVHNDIIQEEPVFERLIQKGEHFAESLKPGEEKDAVNDKLHEIKHRYNDIVDRSKTMHDTITTVVPVAQKFVEKSVTFKEWLKQTEDAFNDLEPVPCDEEELSRQVKHVKVCS